MINKVGVNSRFNHISTQQKKTQNVQKEEKIGRIEEIKKRLERGEYKIDIEKTAQAIAKSLL